MINIKTDVVDVSPQDLSNMHEYIRNNCDESDETRSGDPESMRETGVEIDNISTRFIICFSKVCGFC